jgi:hypothetical protein
MGPQELASHRRGVAGTELLLDRIMEATSREVVIFLKCLKHLAMVSITPTVLTVSNTDING